MSLEKAQLAPMSVENNKPPVSPVNHQRSSNVYIPPARMALMQKQVSDVTSEEYQRIAWDALKKSINGIVNKVNTSNLKEISIEIFSENIVRGRGVLAKTLLRAQTSALSFTAVYAALVAVINSKLPMAGELILKRLIVQFRKSYRRNEKPSCISSAMFISHLVNQRVAHEILVLEILTLLLERPTDDSVEIAVALTKECGAFLSDNSPKAVNAIFERFRVILHQSLVDKRVQYMIEVLFQLRREKFKKSTIPSELDLIDEDDQVTHFLQLDDEFDTEDQLNLFKYDENYEENEAKYSEIKAEVVGEEDEQEEGVYPQEEQRSTSSPTLDQTGADLVNLRKKIYLTIMSSLDADECCHKLVKLNSPPFELCEMVVECCSQEKTFLPFFGKIGERLCKLQLEWFESFTKLFSISYETCHRLDASKLRNVAKLFAYLLSTDSLDWCSLRSVVLTEEETTSANRVFLKNLFLGLLEELGMDKLIIKIAEERENLLGIFPEDEEEHLRFSVNYFTAIGMGRITEEMRRKLDVKRIK